MDPFRLAAQSVGDMAKLPLVSLAQTLTPHELQGSETSTSAQSWYGRPRALPGRRLSTPEYELDQMLRGRTMERKHRLLKEAAGIKLMGLASSGELMCSGGGRSSENSSSCDRRKSTDRHKTDRQ